MLSRCPQHRLVHGGRNEDVLSGKVLERRNQPGRSLQVLVSGMFLANRHIFTAKRLSLSFAEKVHRSKNSFVLGLFRKFSSAWCRRDLTVPSGIAIAWAISASSSPSTKRSSTTSR